MILAGPGIKVALGAGGVAAIAVFTGVAGGASQETGLASQPTTITALCDYPPPDSSTSSDGQANANVTATSSHALARLDLDSAKQQVAQLIVATATADHLPQRAAVIAVATAIQESGLGRDQLGDHGTSFGVFQQKPSSGYGTRAEILDPRHAAEAFYHRLIAIPHWQTLPLTQAAQAVQHSGHPDAYAPHEHQAEQIVTAISSSTAVAPSAPHQQAADQSLTAEEKDTIETELIAAAATGRSPATTTSQITQAIQDQRTLTRTVQVTAASRPRISATITQQIRASAAHLCTELTNDLGDLPAGTAGSTRGLIAVHSALTMLGTSYAWGGGGTSGPSYGTAQGSATKGFDCSGLAQYAWAKAGIRLNRVAADQYNDGPHVSRGQLQPGDLLFFATNPSDPATIHHVGINLDGQHMVESPSTGKSVRVSRWTSRPDYAGAVRPGK